MEIECSQCHRKFHSTKEDAELCPDCLKNEFAAVAPSLDARERAALAAEYQESIKRQALRAETMGGAYSSGVVFSVAGKMRLALGLGIFLVCCFVFLISDTESESSLLAGLDRESQRLISLILCVVSAVLVATAGVRHKRFARCVAVIIALAGWFMPDIMAAAQQASPVVAEEETDKVELPARPEVEEPEGGPVLSDADLQVFYTLDTPSTKVTNYAVFIDHQDSRTRALVREALNRLLEAEFTRAYTRANGALYIVTNAPGERRNISHLLSRFGKVTHAVPAKGVYEVRFDADRANLVSQYSPDVLSSPVNNSYVTANLSELRSLDTMRVRMSARSLAASNVRVLRPEIRDTLVEVLREPWATEPDTYTALVEALVTYCRENDKEAVSLALKYFETRRVLMRDVSPGVTRYLIREVPDEMVNPILDFWFENSIVWSEMLNLLGNRVQPKLLERLSDTNNIRQITTILKYLQERGTAEALPALERFLDYPDSIIRHSARATYEAIQSR